MIHHKAIIVKTDNTDYKFCVELFNSTDDGENFFLVSCRYYRTKKEAEKFLRAMGYYLESEGENNE